MPANSALHPYFVGCLFNAICLRHEFLALSLGCIGFKSGFFVVNAFKLWRQYSDEQARQTFKFSLVHLSVLFAAMLVDHYLF